MENTIKQFCQAWSKNDYSKMYGLCTTTWKAKNTKTDLKNLIIGKIKSFRIVFTEYNSKFPCLCDINIKVKYKGKVKELKARLIKESKLYATSEEGTWGVNPISVIRNLYVKS